MNTIDDDFIEVSSACVKHVQDRIKNIISERKRSYTTRADGQSFVFLIKKSIALLEQLIRLDMHDAVRKDLAQSITEIKKMQTAADLKNLEENQDIFDKKILKFFFGFAIFLLALGVPLMIAGNKFGEVMSGMGAMMLVGSPIFAFFIAFFIGIYREIIKETKK